MKIRPLDKKDAPLIIEWMKDEDINQFFRFNAASLTLKDIHEFIEGSREGNHLHYAVVDDADDYLGTVSLKNIDEIARNAEYAISMRKEAHGTGAARYATLEILGKAFNELGLERVYLNVLSENIRANRFYEKFGFIYEGEFRKHLYIRGELKDLKWYRMLKEEYGRLVGNE